MALTGRRAVPVQLPTPKPHHRFHDRSGSSLAATTVLLVAASACCALVWTLPAPLVLPAIGVLATLAAALAALTAWLTTRQPAPAVTFWDVAGALTLIGIVATLLSEPELVLPFLQNQRTE
jgi:hypothetical protein